MRPENEIKGLGGEPKSLWPKSVFRGTAIESLKPDSAAHDRVLGYLTERLQRSEKAMNNFESRWKAAEVRTQTYIRRSDFEKVLETLNKRGDPSRPLNITVPYVFSTLNSIVTYLMHTFVARRPMFVVETNKEENVQNARMMENLLQHNAEHEKLIKKFRQFFWDGELYGVGIMRTEWKTETGVRSVLRPKTRQVLGVDVTSFFGEPEVEEQAEEYTAFQGTGVTNIEPQNFFPDPSVPMSEVSQDGEFVFWRQNIGKHILLKEQSAGSLRYINYIPSNTSTDDSNDSDRGRVANSPTDRRRGGNALTDSNLIEVHFCSIDLIPRELGLGEETDVRKWIFAIGNRQQILMAEPLTNNHRRHPVVISEPYTLGYELGQPSIADYLGPLQDLMSWYANSHVHNVRTSLNNMFLYNPQMVNENDIKNPAPGKGIRMLPAAFGTDTDRFFRQLDVRDVTARHLDDLQSFTRIADVMSGVNDNIRGAPEPDSSRRTASEVRISAQSAASRLADHARLISSQAITELTMMMCVNYQQYLSEEFYIRVVGNKGIRTPLAVNRDTIAGDFTYPVHDGTLPIDKAAIVDSWKEIFQAVSADPLLRQQHDLSAMLDWIATTSGVSNLKDFKVQQQVGEPGEGSVPLNEIIGGLA